MPTKLAYNIDRSKGKASFQNKSIPGASEGGKGAQNLKQRKGEHVVVLLIVLMDVMREAMLKMMMQYSIELVVSFASGQIVRRDLRNEVLLEKAIQELIIADVEENKIQVYQNGSGEQNFIFQAYLICFIRAQRYISTVSRDSDHQAAEHSNTAVISNKKKGLLQKGFLLIVELVKKILKTLRKDEEGKSSYQSQEQQDSEEDEDIKSRDSQNSGQERNESIVLRQLQQGQSEGNFRQNIEELDPYINELQGQNNECSVRQNEQKRKIQIFFQNEYYFLLQVQYGQQILENYKYFQAQLQNVQYLIADYATFSAQINLSFQNITIFISSFKQLKDINVNFIKLISENNKKLLVIEELLQKGKKTDEFILQYKDILQEYNYKLQEQVNKNNGVVLKYQVVLKQIQNNLKTADNHYKSMVALNEIFVKSSFNIETTKLNNRYQEFNRNYFIRLLSLVNSSFGQNQSANLLTGISRIPQIIERELEVFHQHIFQIAQEAQYYPEHIQKMIPVIEEKWIVFYNSNPMLLFQGQDVIVKKALTFYKQMIIVLTRITKFVGLWADKYLLECFSIKKTSESNMGLYLMEEEVNVYQTTFLNRYQNQEEEVKQTDSGASTSEGDKKVWLKDADGSIELQDQSMSEMEIFRNRIIDIQKSKCVGIFQAVWKDKNGRVVQVGFATAFAISPHLIVTCAHSIFDNNTYRQCTEAYFISTEEGKRSKQENIYPIKAKSFAEYTKIKRGERYGLEPLREDIAVLALQQRLESSFYLSLSKRPLMKGDKVEIWGFPSKHYEMVTPRLGTQFKRVNLEGQYCYSKGDSRGKYITVHSCLTSGGHSGSPIIRLVQTEGRQPFYEVVAMHTHRGIDAYTNEGLEMTKEMRRNVWTFAKRLCRRHGFQQWNFIKKNFIEIEEYRDEDEDDMSMISSELQKQQVVDSTDDSSKEGLPSRMIVFPKQPQ